MPAIFNSEDENQTDAAAFLSAGMIHDLNNLLTVINGHNEIVLSSRELPEKVRQSASAVRTAGQRAACLAHALMAAGRSIPLDSRYTDLNHCVAELVSLTRNLLPENIELATVLANSLPGVIADPCAILQVLLNLAMNACDAMPAGGRLEIETRHVSTNPAAPSEFPQAIPRGNYVILTVRDNGIGMDQPTRERIFDPFYSTKRAGYGTGLGLPMVQHIVRESGGLLDIESAPGKGSSVHIYLPTAVDSPPADLEEANASCVPPGKRENILLVEDDADLRNLMRNILGNRGYAVLAAGTAAEATELAATLAGPLDLLISDVELPDSSGPRLAAALRKSFPRLAVLNISGYPPREAADDEPPADGEFLPKPFTVGELGRAVRDTLDRRKCKRILFVDDDEQVLAFAREVLVSAGYEVLDAGDGNVALAIAQKEPLDLVITDLVMRDREGLDTMMQLRKSHPGLPVIAISGAFGGYFLRSASMLGARATLAKPFSGDDLLAVVHMVLES